MSKNATSKLQKLVATGIQAAKAYGREDLADRLQQLQQEKSSPGVTAVILGQFKQGKSSLVNALVGAKPCAVDDDIATAVPTFVSYGPKNSARVLVEDEKNEEGKKLEIPWDELATYVTERSIELHNLPIKGVEVELPRKFLEQGVSLVDTPGVGGLGSAYATASLGTLSFADVGVFVSDASQEFTQPEIEYLKHAQELCPRVVCVATKIDLYPAWREVLKINQQHLQNFGIDVSILPVSSFLREEAVKRNDTSLNEESGCGQLVRLLSGDCLTQSEQHQQVEISNDLLSVCQQISSQLEAELSAINDYSKKEVLMADLEEAKSRSEKLKSLSARWSVTLNDGIGDLTSDVDYDFRTRIRQVTADADTAIESFDPLKNWDEFEPWLVNLVSQHVVSNYQFLTQRSTSLSEEVAEHFALDGGNLFHQLSISGADTPLSKVAFNMTLEQEKDSVSAKGLTVLKGSYSGMLMCTVLGSMVSVTPLAPIAVGLGLMMGRKSLKDEKERAIKKRRSEAKNSMRRYCDEVSFQVNKDSRDTLRKVQRQLRDHYSERAEELHRSTSEAFKAAAQAVQASESERTKRAKDLQAEIARVTNLVEQVKALQRGGAHV